MFVCMFVCYAMPPRYLYVCMLCYSSWVFVCMFVCYATPPGCLYVCLYVMLLLLDVCMYVMLLLDALHLERQTFRGSSTVPQIFKIHPTIAVTTNGQITLCSYYVQLSTMLFEQLCTIVDNVYASFVRLSELYTARARCH